MGKVIPYFGRGWPGTVSRSVDDIIVSLKNTGGSEIPYGAPVFLDNNGDGVVGFTVNGSQTFEKFVGFAVRVPNKTPETYPAGQDMNIHYGSQQGAWKSGDVIEVLVRGSIVVAANNGFLNGGKVYIRKNDGRLVPSAGADGSTVLLENVRVRCLQTAMNNSIEVVVTERNIQ